MKLRNLIITIGTVLLLLGMANKLFGDPLTEQLKAFDPLPKVTPSWPMIDRVTSAPDLLREMGRVLRCLPIDLQFDSFEKMKRIAAAEPEWIAVVIEPYKKAAFLDFENPSWTKEEVCGPLTAKDMEYWGWFWARCVKARMAIPAQTKVMVLLQHELNTAAGPWPSGCDDDVRRDKLNVMYRIAKTVFDGPVSFFNHDRWAPGGAASGHLGRRRSPTPIGTHSDHASFSINHDIESVYVSRTLQFTADATGDAPLIANVAVGGQFELLPYTPRGHDKRSPDVIGQQQLGKTWLAGYLLYSPFVAKYPDSFGPWFRVEYVCLWPPPLRVGTDEHFLMFLRGAHETRIPRVRTEEQ